MDRNEAWMVRAGRGGRFFDDFKERSFVGVGWREIGSLASIKSRDEVVQLVRGAYPALTDQAVVVAAGQLFRFAADFQVGDRVVTYDPRARMYLCGEISGSYTYVPEAEDEEYLNQRAVQWHHEMSRDDLSQVARNALGSTLAIFKIPNSITAELWREGGSANVSESDEPVEVGVGNIAPLSLDQVSSLANEAIKDQIAKLDWQDMQELVAGVLRSLGYKTVVSPPGSDRGRDIVASPDGFGFQNPRIVVEVKHRRTQRMGSQEIRSFLGGRHSGDKGLYVSTGGFTKEAYYEAERASIPLTLMDFELLVETILENYSNLDEVTKQIIPLKRLYWPVSLS